MSSKKECVRLLLLVCALLSHTLAEARQADGVSDLWLGRARSLTEEFYQFAASLGVEAPAFLWSSRDGTPPESLLTMVVPSHLLVRRDGTILRTWPGTTKSRKTRFRMVNQIVADTLDAVSQER